jgi:hypothetical protein
MARQRMIHPSFFTDGELWEGLPDWALLFYVGLWTEAEDSGCIIGHAGTLKNRVLAARSNITPAKVQEVLDKLVELGKLVAYIGGDPEHPKTYYWLVNFHRHQRIDYPTPPKLPLPDFIIWEGEEVHADGKKGTPDYKPNRRKWTYRIQ